jgi:hypothetical protein
MNDHQVKMLFLIVGGISIAIGGVLSYKGKPGWGWFVFVGTLLCMCPTK